MMPSKRILLVLDDVDHRDQLEALAGSPKLFYPVSLIIFTSKDKQLLRSHRVDEIYNMEFLNDDESLELFASYAFKENHTASGFEEVAKKVVKYVKGHPLALKVLGRFLYEKPLCEWVSELDSLKLHPNDEIQRVLRRSYDDLNYTNIRVLVDKSLISISSDSSLQMHDLIQAMTKAIIREESTMHGKPSRLWISFEIYDVFCGNEVTEAVEVVDLMLKVVDVMLKKSCREDYRWDFELKDINMKLSGSLDFLSNELRLLDWKGFPFRLLPSSFYPKNIVAIDLSYSNIKHLWTTPKCLLRLKVMKLRHCRMLTSTPNFTEITNMEKLILEGCVNLTKLHPSVGTLKRLVVLDLRNCFFFFSTPSTGIQINLLQVRIVYGFETELSVMVVEIIQRKEDRK
ncbi:disease resistance protein Roq1-like [Rutidosis leptorrhynchoides]|uniref:disease resistance protein Roq1-like n=1 Tax=Rutidosis leptorrhynchoides TaxID=125765 RepID=UPI003A99705C